MSIRHQFLRAISHDDYWTEKDTAVNLNNFQITLFVSGNVSNFTGQWTISSNFTMYIYIEIQCDSRNYPG